MSEDAWRRPEYRGVAADAVGLLAGYALDAVLGDPRRFHPVAGFGTAAGALERRLYAHAGAPEPPSRRSPSVPLCSPGSPPRC